jgi:AP-1-like factor
MEAYHDVAQLWDFSHPSNFSQLPEDDFLALLQKHSANSSAISPPSEDSSPSTPNSNNDPDDSHDPAPKRKASDGGLEDGGPNQKAQHTLDGNKKGSNLLASIASRRKSGGSGSHSNKDESRLLKRKEQNRAAQRAFRERKEKHVKDLEDKVAALEAKNEQAISENENLRDLLTRLQTENVMLKQQPHQQASFTFSVPKNAAAGGGIPNSYVDSPLFSPSSTVSQAPTVLPSPASPTSSSKYNNPLDWSSLTSFDPSALNVLDEPLQPTATSGAMNMDFGFGDSSDALPGFPYTTIASNPAFFTLASTFDSVTPPHQNELTSPPSNGNQYNFDFGSLSPWPTPNQLVQDAPFSELYNGFMPSSNTADYNAFLANTPESTPVAGHIDSISSTSSSASSASSPSDLLRTPVSDAHTSPRPECPKSRDACRKAVEDSGASPFAPPSQTNPNSLTAVLKKTTDINSATMISCSGSKFPKTQQSDNNIEVLTAWRTITSHPEFKDVDVNDLCAEFSSKARCDGTKVVLEPQGVTHILETFSRK